MSQPDSPGLRFERVSARWEGGASVKLPPERPGWFDLILREAVVDGDTALFADELDFVGNFMGEAPRIWREDRRSQLRSGVLCRVSDDGLEHYFECTALVEAETPTLRFELLGTDYESLLETVPGARNSLLQLVEHAHQMSTERLRLRDDLLPDPPPLLELIMTDDGTIDGIEAPPRGGVPLIAEVELPAKASDVLSEDLAQQMLAHAKLARETDSPQRFVLSQAYGTRQRYHEIRIEPRKHARLHAKLYDVSERKAVEDYLGGLAVADSLTGLANRALFSERLRRAVGRARRHGRKMAVMMIDLDGFKAVNDTRGHQVGDELLKSVARRLNGPLRATDTLARWGGDEFVAVIEDLSQFRDVETAAQKFVECFAEPFVIGGQAMRLSASIGIAISPDHGVTEEQLVSSADRAMYQVKSAGKDGFGFVDREPEFLRGQRTLFRRELQAAVDRGDFLLLYQPLFAVADRRIRAAEALLRWQHPTRGRLDPSHFINMAESSGAMPTLDLFALSQACRDATTWPHDDWEPVVCVNLSRTTLRLNDLPMRIEHILELTGLAPRRLEIEVSESVVASGGEAITRALSNLRAGGIRLSIDDFGTGQMSIRQLRQICPERLKIDNEFIESSARTDDGERFCAAMVGLAHGLGIEVVAEGVAADFHLSSLDRIGCDTLQGHALSEPIDSDHLMRQLENPGTSPGDQGP